MEYKANLQNNNNELREILNSIIQPNDSFQFKTCKIVVKNDLSLNMVNDMTCIVPVVENQQYTAKTIFISSFGGIKEIDNVICEAPIFFFYEGRESCLYYENNQVELDSGNYIHISIPNNKSNSTIEIVCDEKT